MLWGSLQIGRSNFEPCPLYVLAEYMRAGKWLDLYVEDVGLVMRVRIIEMVVRVRGEDIVVRQEWPDGTHDELRKGTLVFDSEVIWKARPTLYSILEVEPHRPATDEGADLTEEQLSAVVSLALVEAARATGLAEEEVTRSPSGRREEGAVTARHLWLLTVYECSNVPSDELCKRLGWLSPQPFLTAKLRLRRARQGSPRRFSSQLELCCTNVRRKSGYAHARRRRDSVLGA